MKKFIIFIILLLIFPMYGKAVDYISFNDINDPNDELSFDIESFKINPNSIDISGWAFSNEMQTIGGKNNKISIIALKKSKLGQFKKNKENYGLNNNTDYIEKKVEPGKYTGGNNLYASLCYALNETKDGKKYKVCEYPNEVTCEKLPEGASPQQKQKNSCVHYNPGFKISFSINELKEKFDDESITFILHIEYTKKEAKNENGCKINVVGDGTFNGCLDSGIKNNIYRTVALSREIDRSNAFGMKVNDETEEKFTITTNYGLVRQRSVENNSLLDPIGGYFENSENHNEYILDKSQTDKFRIKQYLNIYTGESVKSEVTNYYVSVGKTVQRIDGTYHQPSGINLVGSKCTNCYYASSTWGVINGYVSIKLSSPPKPEEFTCTLEGSDGCNIKKTKKCRNHQVIFNSISTTALNDSDCKDKATLNKIVLYDFEEQYIFSINSNLNNAINPGRYIENFGFTLDRIITNISRSKSDEKYYYYGNKYSKTDEGFCEPTADTWLSYDYLKSLGNEDINDFLRNNKVNKLYKIESIKEDALVYSYPNPNSNDEEDNLTEDAEIMYFGKLTNIEDVNIVAGERQNLLLKKAWININNASVEYSKSSPDTKYISGGENRYYIPFDAPITIYDKKGVAKNALKFETNIKDISIINNTGILSPINSVCYFKVEDGALEKVNYRVIDLNNPFPNKPPTLNERASNWYALYNTKMTANVDYLAERATASNVEKYTFNLSDSVISKIRDYNSSKVSKDETYINTNPNAKNSLLKQEFIKFTSSNISKSNLGEAGGY